MKCPDCGTEMNNVASWLKGEPVFGGRNSSYRLYQCPKCKTVSM